MDRRPPRPADISAARWTLAGSLALLLAGVLLYAFFAPSVNAIGLQVAGAARRANHVIGGRAHDFRVALGWDFVLIAGYATGLAIICRLGRHVFWTSPLTWAAFAGMWLAIAAGACNVAQDVVLLLVLRRVPVHTGWPLKVAQALSFMKFSAVLFAGVIGACAWGTALSRVVMSAKTTRKIAALGPDDVIPPPPAEKPFRADPGAAHLDRSPAGEGADHWNEDLHVPKGRKPAHVGIAVSGGGVRAGTVALGALQALRDAGLLLRARYLFSVSGGGYVAGAFQRALRAEGGGPGPADGPKEVFRPGSVEEDHVRRHSSYLSDGPKEWLAALGVLLRGVLSSLAVIALAVATVGIATGWFYRVTRIADLRSLRRFLADGSPTVEHGPRFLYPTRGVGIAILGLAVLALSLYLARLLSASYTGKRAAGLLMASDVAILLTILFAVVGIGIPVAVWFSVWVIWKAGWRATAGTIATTGAVTGGLMYVGTLLAALWRKRKRITGALGGLKGLLSSKKSTQQVVPNSMAQMLLLWICTLVILAALALVSGWVAATGIDRSFWSVAPIAALAVVIVFFDQTSMSLHPFYRRRIASAFAVRRGERRGEPVAVPYDYVHEGTPLYRYAEELEPFPKVVFCASANLSGQEITPPGRRTVSYTLADDFVGGPQVGWVKTEKLQQLVTTPIAHDLTVQAAVAISGAAFASAMGSQTRFFEVFLALSNARLGAWLPNPGFVARKRDHPDDWTLPGLPGIRRLSYFAREILGLHPETSRMLLCTDGGHYDNLGLVELLRHRCRVAICIDATGDQPPLATTLAQAITLAHEELGVTVALRPHPLDVVPGSADELEPKDPLSMLNAKLSKGLVVVGDITYPAPVHYEDDETRGFPPITSDKGVLVLAKAALTPDLPYELLSFAIDDPAFPRDGTSDQWFNCEQFDAYQGLGHWMGTRANDVVAGLVDATGQPLV